MDKLNLSIAKLVQYGLESELITGDETVYVTNLLLDLFQESEYEAPADVPSGINLEETLQELLDIAVEKGLTEDSIVYRDLFDTRIMNTLAPRPAQVIRTFWEKYEESPETATDYFYKLSQDTDYIRRYRLCKDMRWTVDSPYGVIDLSINLSKPEKDPKAIAAAKNAKQGGYPKCLLCMENVGYADRKSVV